MGAAGGSSEGRVTWRSLWRRRALLQLFAAIGTQFRVAWQPKPVTTRPAPPSSSISRQTHATVFLPERLLSPSMRTTSRAEPLCTQNRPWTCQEQTLRAGVTDLCLHPRQGPQANSSTPPSLHFLVCEIRVMLFTPSIIVIPKIHKRLTQSSYFLSAFHTEADNFQSIL